MDNVWIDRKMDAVVKNCAIEDLIWHSDAQKISTMRDMLTVGCNFASQLRQQFKAGWKT